jgi:hypothetical protein
MWTSNFYNFWDIWNLYHKVTFDGENRLILVNYGETSLNVEQDIYSDWKEWQHLEDYSKYPQALSVVGGEPLGGGQFVGATFFLENGWRVRPWEGTHALNINGNIYTREAGQSPTIPTLGYWNIATTFVRSAIVFKVETTSGTTGSISINPDQIAQAIWQWPVTGSLPIDTFGDHVYRKLLTLAQYMATK